MSWKKKDRNSSSAKSGLVENSLQTYLFGRRVPLKAEYYQLIYIFTDTSQMAFKEKFGIKKYPTCFISDVNSSKRSQVT